MQLSIIVPVYNETKRITSTLNSILSFVKTKGYDCEILVVDDGSTDGTLDLVKREFPAARQIKTFRNEANRGKGYVVRQGMLEAKGDVILYTDADLASPIEEMEKLLPFIKSGYDVVAGSRIKKSSDSKVSRLPLRFIMGRIFNLFVRLIISPDLTDTQCGFKMLTNEAAKKIFPKQKINTFSFDAETMYLARKLGYKSIEVPVSWSEIKHTKVHFIRDPLMMVRDLIRIRILHRGKDEFSAKK